LPLIPNGTAVFILTKFKAFPVKLAKIYKTNIVGLSNIKVWMFT